MEFLRAVPVFAAGRENDMNLTCVFTARVPPSDARLVLRLTASCLYRAALNGERFAYGPARAAHGCFRVDEWDLSPHLAAGENLLTVEVAGYHINTFYTLEQPAFLQAEVLGAGSDAPLLWTSPAGGGFTARVQTARVQRVQRYSYQRPFVEVWDLTRPPAAPCALAAQPGGTLLPRLIDYPVFARHNPRPIASGTVVLKTPESYFIDRAQKSIGPDLHGFARAELEVCLSEEAQQMAFTPGPQPAGLLRKNTYWLYEWERSLGGFPHLDVTVTKPAVLTLLFDEIAPDGDIAYLRNNECVNAVRWVLPVGTHRLETFEAYGLRYGKLVLTEGECRVDDFWIREYAAPIRQHADPPAPCPDDLAAIYRAAAHSFAANAVDALVDATSRERACWLQDSFWTARAAYHFTGRCDAEHLLFDNYLRGTFRRLPPGMIPGCYPADQDKENFYIPTHAMWYILELEEYLARSGDAGTVRGLREQIYGLLRALDRFANEDGLLEDLGGWVFVEWGPANRHFAGVNYPVNMTYCAALEAVARLYGDPALEKRAARCRAAIAAQTAGSFFFPDHALRGADGRLRPQPEYTEIAQYIAIRFGFAASDTHAELRRVMMAQFGPGRDEKTVYPAITRAQVLFGYQMRLEWLLREGQFERLRREIPLYYAHMAKTTGTLWEHDTPKGCLTQAAPSYAAVVIDALLAAGTGRA